MLNHRIHLLTRRREVTLLFIEVNSSVQGMSRGGTGMATPAPHLSLAATPEWKPKPSREGWYRNLAVRQGEAHFI